jgi:putative GTP pyrophosphokinase
MSANTGNQDPDPATEGAPAPVVATFDLDAHSRKAVREYEAERARHNACAEAVKDLLETALDDEGIRPASITARSKTPESFRKKAAKPSDHVAAAPKYPHPLAEITDLAGVRVVVFLLVEVEQVSRIIEREFRVTERDIMGGLFDEHARGGYQSVHFLVSFRGDRENLVEYRSHKGLITEIQVRTLLQHAWAESSITESIRRKFLSLAGVIEVADREFQAIYEEAAEATRPSEPEAG